MNLKNKLLSSKWYVKLKKVLSQGINKSEIFMEAIVGSIIEVIPLLGLSIFFAAMLSISPIKYQCQFTEDEVRYT